MIFDDSSAKSNNRLVLEEGRVQKFAEVSAVIKLAQILDRNAPKTFRESRVECTETFAPLTVPLFGVDDDIN